MGLSPDEFASVAFCAGFDSTDIAWMDTFEAICCEHGCDPAVGVSKEAFLELVNEGFDRRRRSGCPSPTAGSSFQAQEMELATRGCLTDFRELPLELGLGTIAQLGLDESGYLWACQVFQ